MTDQNGRSASGGGGGMGGGSATLSDAALALGTVSDAPSRPAKPCKLALSIPTSARTVAIGRRTRRLALTALTPGALGAAHKTHKRRLPHPRNRAPCPLGVLDATSGLPFASRKSVDCSPVPRQWRGGRAPPRACRREPRHR